MKSASTARTLTGDEVMKVRRLGSCENFVGKREERSLYSMRSVILSQRRERRIGVI